MYQDIAELNLENKSQGSQTKDKAQETKNSQNKT